MSKGPLISLQSVDIKLLRIFAAVVRNGGFAAAQAELNIASSSISDSISQLETRLGLRLCERGRSGFLLTEDGRKAHEAAVRVLEALDRFRSDVGDIKGEMVGALRLGTVDAIASATSWILHETIRRFSELAPGVQIRVELDSTQALVAGLLQDRYDAAVVPIYRRIGDLDLVHVGKSRQTLFCGREHPLFTVPDDRLDMDTIAKAPFVALTHMQGWSHPANIQFNEQASTSYMEGVATLVLSNAYVGFLAEHYAQSWVDMGAMRPLLPDKLSYGSDCYLAAAKRMSTSRIINAFMTVARKIQNELGYVGQEAE